MARTGGAPLPTITPDSALGGSVIERSLRFNSTDTTYLSKSFASNGNRQTFTISCWIKKTHPSNRQVMMNQTATAGSNEDGFEFDGTKLRFYSYVGGSFVFQLTTNRRFRDVNGWYHIVAVYDSPQATESNRAKVYINGTQETDLSTATYPSQNNTVGYFNTTTDELRIGNQKGNQYKLDGYMAEINFIDGTALDPSYFGYTEFQTGIWRPKRYEGTYGTNGFYLDFSDNSSTTSLGIDKSPNGNDFTANNFSVSAGVDNDSFTDTPTSENIFAQLNSNLPTNSGASYRNGNYTFYMTHDNNHHRASSNMPVNSGKWYAEFKLTTYSFQSGSYPYIGVCAEDLWINSWTGDAGTSYQTGGGIWRDGSNIESTGTTYTQGDIISVAMNLDSSPPQVWWAKNGTYIRDASANPATGAYGVNIEPASNTGYYNFAMSLWASTGQWDANFGQRAFSYDIPSGFKTLCTDNIRSTQSIIPKKHFDVLTWTGNGSTGQNITGLNFKPDLLWIKKRNESESWGAYDSIRGVNKRFYLNDNHQEITETTMSAFYHGGFRVEGSGGGATNDNSDTYVGFCWKAGGTAVSNSDGSITTSISANQEAGFSIVTWTGTGSNSTVGHGLGKAPKVVICKLRDTTTQDWFFMPGEITGERGKYIKFNTTDGVASDIHTFPATAPTSTVFTVGGEDGGNSSNGNGSKYVAYCWAEIPGYSKFGQYKGNGSADGPYVHLGFRPALLITRRIDSGDHWIIRDSTRNTDNPVYSILNPNATSSEFGSSGHVQNVDFLSNGFKITGSDSGQNGSTGTYLYMAFAEQTALTAFDQTNPNAR